MRKLRLDKRMIECLTSNLSAAASMLAEGDKVKLTLRKNGYRLDWVDAEHKCVSYLQYSKVKP